MVHGLYKLSIKSFTLLFKNYVGNSQYFCKIAYAPHDFWRNSNHHLSHANLEGSSIHLDSRNGHAAHLRVRHSRVRYHGTSYSFCWECIAQFYLMLFRQTMSGWYVRYVWSPICTIKNTSATWLHWYSD